MSDNSGSVTAPTDDAERLANIEAELAADADYADDDVFPFAIGDARWLVAALTRLQERADACPGHEAQLTALVAQDQHTAARADRAEDRVKKLEAALREVEPVLSRVQQHGLSSCEDARRNSLLNADQHSSGCTVEAALRLARALIGESTEPLTGQEIREVEDAVITGLEPDYFGESAEPQEGQDG